MIRALVKMKMVELVELLGIEDLVGETPGRGEGPQEKKGDCFSSHSLIIGSSLILSHRELKIFSADNRPSRYVTTISEPE
jgi:hypothetical protein